MLAACGRFGFNGDDHNGDASFGDGKSDSGTDAFVCVGGPQHDEDGDGVIDSCDVCPHIADPGQADADGDRVGDACDPEPAIPRQQIAVFDPFTSIDPAWTNSGGTIAGDQLVLDARG